MKIIELTAENVKRLKAVAIRPDGNLVEISGRNGQGKSSVLDAIWWALAGSSHIQAVPIRKGETEARIRLDLGELKVIRTFKKREDETFTTSIVVESQEGARFPSPQRMLDSLLGELSFDPLAFSRMDGRQQLEALKRFVPGVDFAAIEKANKADFDRRTDVNRQAKALRAQAAGIGVPAGAPAERIDETALVEEMERAGEHNADLERRKARLEQAGRDIAIIRTDANRERTLAQDLREKAEAAEARAKSQDEAADDLQRKLDQAPALPEVIDTSAVRRQIDEARKKNRAVDLREQRAAVEARAREAEETSSGLTKAIEDRTAAKREAIAKAALPVSGIAFGEDEILLNGVPFEQASSAEQLRTSVAIAIAANPKLRVIRVQDGSLLDDEAMAILAEMADAADCQVWVEVVQSGRSTAVVIEDGQVRGAVAVSAQAAE
ncbi:MAG: AAA family ATPase [Methylorubrum rhodinum]|uniref:AAA family ATPase n=1 Tax=Methylorubrum rhodinum TaxID=29428 RepID=UPI003BB0FF6B